MVRPRLLNRWSTIFRGRGRRRGPAESHQGLDCFSFNNFSSRAPTSWSSSTSRAQSVRGFLNLCAQPLVVSDQPFHRLFHKRLRVSPLLRGDAVQLRSKFRREFHFQCGQCTSSLRRSPFVVAGLLDRFSQAFFGAPSPIGSSGGASLPFVTLVYRVGHPAGGSGTQTQLILAGSTQPPSSKRAQRIANCICRASGTPPQTTSDSPPKSTADIAPRCRHI